VHRAFILGVGLVAGAQVACLTGETTRPLGERCSSDQECVDALVCRYGVCRSPCAFERDCPEGFACVAVVGRAGERVCTAEGTDSSTACPPGLERAPDGFCRELCEESCDSGYECRGGLCLPCDDGVENGDEVGVDCGGSCSPCPLGTMSALPPLSLSRVEDFDGAGGSWGDLDQDGCPDLLLGADGAGLFFQEQGDEGHCAGLFTNVISTRAAGLLSAAVDRSALIGDFDNDGSLDLALDGAYVLQVYVSSGPPAFVFGTGAEQAPSYALDRSFTWADSCVASPLDPDEQNMEGLGLVDWDADGDLDVVVENSLCGLRLLDNDGAGNFEDLLPGDTGLPGASLETGDHLAVGDLDHDGWVDVVARRGSVGGGELTVDLFFNDGGTFIMSEQIDEPAANRFKGAVLLCDFDSDGWLDVYYGRSEEGGPFLVFRQSSPRVFSRIEIEAAAEMVGIPSATGGEATAGACFDVDNDGDEDLLITGSTSELFINESRPGEIRFVHREGAIDNPGTKGVAVADFDRDGDLDFVANRQTDALIFVNDLSETGLQGDYLAVEPLHRSAGASLRLATGASARLERCDGVGVGPRLELSGGGGRGNCSATPLHFGLGPDGAEQTYVAVVTFVGGRVARRAVVPAAIDGYQRVTIVDDDPDDLTACESAP